MSSSCTLWSGHAIRNWNFSHWWEFLFCSVQSTVESGRSWTSVLQPFSTIRVSSVCPWNMSSVVHFRARRALAATMLASSRWVTSKLRKGNPSLRGDWISYSHIHCPLTLPPAHFAVDMLATSWNYAEHSSRFHGHHPNLPLTWPSTFRQLRLGLFSLVW
jgi:hypothetical protein